MTDAQQAARALDRLVTKLQAIAPLAPEDRDAVCHLPLRLETFEEDTAIVQQGDKPSEAALIVKGFACRYKSFEDGRRQIFSIHVAGDLPDFQSMYLPVMDHSLGTMTPSVVAFIPHEALTEAMQRHPGLTRALWRESMIDSGIFREWLAGVGRRTAHQRIAHLICELYVKLHAVGLAQTQPFEFPVTQLEIADSLGLTAVHVNRVLQDLRRQGLIAYKVRQMDIRDWPGLQAAGDFDPTYLHLRPPIPATV